MNVVTNMHMYMYPLDEHVNTCSLLILCRYCSDLQMTLPRERRCGYVDGISYSGTCYWINALDCAWHVISILRLYQNRRRSTCIPKQNVLLLYDVREKKAISIRPPLDGWDGLSKSLAWPLCQHCKSLQV